MTDKDLADNWFEEDPLDNDLEEEDGPDEPFINPFAEQSTKTPEIQTTYAKHGKLVMNEAVPCTMCQRSFMPEPNVLRIHNRSELVRFLCPKCQKRDDALVCASARLMVTKGGFPPSIDQLVNAFHERDPALVEKDQIDPFEELREAYGHRPLTEDDVYFWIDERYFILNRSNGQLECSIDRIYESPERAQLLGKEGLEGKKMALKKFMRQQMEKRKR